MGLTRLRRMASAVRDAWRLEPLEPRVLLSADPVLEARDLRFAYSGSSAAVLDGATLTIARGDRPLEKLRVKLLRPRLGFRESGDFIHQTLNPRPGCFDTLLLGHCRAQRRQQSHERKAQGCISKSSLARKK